MLTLVSISRLDIISWFIGFLIATIITFYFKKRYYISNGKIFDKKITPDKIKNLCAKNNLKIPYPHHTDGLSVDKLNNMYYIINKMIQIEKICIKKNLKLPNELESRTLSSLERLYEDLRKQ